jgi:hypothetical protein
MLNLKPELGENETVLGEYGATVHQVKGSLVRGSNVRLWLTNLRLILKAGLGPQRTLPLYAITNIREEKVSWYTMIRLEFVNGQMEWLSVQNQAQFLETLKTAQAQAPVIPEGVTPGTTSPAVKGLFGGGLLLIAVIGGCAIISICVFLVAFGGLWYLAQAH